jgi:hypothetical protein
VWFGDEHDSGPLDTAQVFLERDEFDPIAHIGWIIGQGDQFQILNGLTDGYIELFSVNQPAELTTCL